MNEVHLELIKMSGAVGLPKKAKPDSLPPSPEILGLTITQAAAIAGVSVGAFNTARTKGLYPNPTLPGGRIHRKLLERAMDRLSGILTESAVSDPLGEWEATRNARHA